MAGGSLNRGGINKVVDTPDGAETSLLVFGIQPDSVMTFKLGVRAMEKATGDSAFFQFVGGFKRVGTADAEIITLNPANPPANALAENFADQNAASRDVNAWAAAVNLNGAGLEVKVTGEAAKAITWNALLEIDQFILN